MSTVLDGDGDDDRSYTSDTQTVKISNARRVTLSPVTRKNSAAMPTEEEEEKKEATNERSPPEPQELMQLRELLLTSLNSAPDDDKRDLRGQFANAVGGYLLGGGFNFLPNAPAQAHTLAKAIIDNHGMVVLQDGLAEVLGFGAPSPDDVPSNAPPHQAPAAGEVLELGPPDDDTTNAATNQTVSTVTIDPDLAAGNGIPEDNFVLANLDLSAMSFARSTRRTHENETSEDTRRREEQARLERQGVQRRSSRSTASTGGDTSERMLLSASNDSLVANHTVATIEREENETLFGANHTVQTNGQENADRDSLPSETDWSW